MAGLRWWNFVDDEGNSVWNFEARKPEEMVTFSKAEAQIFWFGLIVFPVIWVTISCIIYLIQIEIVFVDMSSVHCFLHFQTEVGCHCHHQLGSHWL